MVKFNIDGNIYIVTIEGKKPVINGITINRFNSKKNKNEELKEYYDNLKSDKFDNPAWRAGLYFDAPYLNDISQGYIGDLLDSIVIDLLLNKPVPEKVIVKGNKIKLPNKKLLIDELANYYPNFRAIYEIV